VWHAVEQAARRPAGEPGTATSTYRGAGSGAPTAAASGPATAVAASTSPTARPSASSRLASESVAIAHSGRSRIPPASATAATTAAIAMRRSPTRSAPELAVVVAATGVTPASTCSRVSASRADRPTPVTSPASTGVSSTLDSEYHHTVASTRRSSVRCRSARRARTCAVQSGSASNGPGTTVPDGGATRPSAAAPGTRAATTACAPSSVTPPVCPVENERTDLTET
jgi:hypothetical protein